MNEACKRVTGKDARTIAVQAILDDIEQGVMYTLPQRKAEAIAVLLGGVADEASLKLATEILRLVNRAEPDGVI